MRPDQRKKGTFGQLLEDKYIPGVEANSTLAMAPEKLKPLNIFTLCTACQYLKNS
jgi:hypothetical protein